MTIFLTTVTDPYFNLASEEYLIDNFPDDVFMLWRNEPSVIIGRSQNAFAELDADFIDRRGIAVVRRLTGGGAVFHDLGNVNFTFIAGDDGSEPDFGRFCRPIISALAGLGVEAGLSGRNDIVCQGLKISGNAQAHRSGRILLGRHVEPFGGAQGERGEAQEQGREKRPLEGREPERHLLSFDGCHGVHGASFIRRAKGFP